MAIYHLHAAVVSRGKGHSAVAKAAYRSAQRLTDERTGEVKDYARRRGVEFAGMYLPKDAPEWARDRERLWNEVERREDNTTRRATAQLAREIEVSLPHELTDQQRRYLVEDFVKENFTRKGLVADVAIHAPHRSGDERNYHAHIMVTMRALEADGFASTKARELNNRAALHQWRKSWERHANRHLERWGHSERVDCRTLEEQGVDREPTIKMGEAATELERRGIGTDRGEINRAIAQHNRERQGQARDAVVVELNPARSGRTMERTRDSAPQQAAQAADKAAGVILDAATRIVGGVAEFLVGGSPSPRPAPDPEQQRRDAVAQEEHVEKKAAIEVNERQTAENERQRKIDDVVRRMKQQREEEQKRDREHGGRDRDR